MLKWLNVKKDYSYIMLMAAKSLDVRVRDKGSVTRPVELSSDDLRLISPTVGVVEPKASRDLRTTVQNLSVLTVERTVYRNFINIKVTVQCCRIAVLSPWLYPLL